MLTKDEKETLKFLRGKCCEKSWANFIIHMGINKQRELLDDLKKHSRFLSRYRLYINFCDNKNLIPNWEQFESRFLEYFPLDFNAALQCAIVFSSFNTVQYLLENRKNNINTENPVDVKSLMGRWIPTINVGRIKYLMSRGLSSVDQSPIGEQISILQLAIMQVAEAVNKQVEQEVRKWGEENINLSVSLWIIKALIAFKPVFQEDSAGNSVNYYVEILERLKLELDQYCNSRLQDTRISKELLGVPYKLEMEYKNEEFFRSSEILGKIITFIKTSHVTDEQLSNYTQGNFAFFQNKIEENCGGGIQITPR